MKTKTLLVLVVVFFALSCEKDEDTYIKPLKVISACGYDDPLNQLEWLNSKINDGKDPSKTNFIENVWIKEYQNKDIIVIRFGLASWMYSTFECSGMTISISDLDFYNTLSADHLIYKYEIK
jgi:hypothetical protein